jgi:hypothetical protein
LESAPQPIEVRATTPGCAFSIAAAAKPAQSPLIFMCESVTQWQA